MLTIILVLIVVGFLVWLFNTLVPMDAKIKQAITGIVLLLVFLYIVSALFGVKLPALR